MLNPCTLRQAGLIVLSLLLPTLANAQQAPAGQSVGIVTAIQGQAAVSRVSLPQPESLHFKDDVFYRDQIATRERSTVRLLLGGKGTLTIREQSQVTLDESVTPDGTRQSVISLLTGKIAAAIAHALMRPGDVIEIRTPNAVAAVRGTVLVAEYIPPQGNAATERPTLLASAPGPLLAQASGAGGTSNLLVISGQITITLQGQPPVTLDTLQSVSIIETAAGPQIGPIQNVTPAQAADWVKDLQVNRPEMGDATSGKVIETQAQIAGVLANVIIQNTAGQAVVATTPVTTTASTTSTMTSETPPPTAPQSPVSTQTSSAVSSGSETGTVSTGSTGGGGTSGGGTGTGGTGGGSTGGGGTTAGGGTAGGTSGGSGSGTPNTLANGSLLTLSNVNLALPDGTSLATFSPGTANTITPITLSGSGTGVLNTPLLTIAGNPITHSGTIVTVDPSTLNGATGPTKAPLVIVNGTSLTNTGGPVFDVNNSFVSAFWPVLQLAPGANATMAGVMNIAEESEVSVGPHDAVSLQSGSTLTSTDALFQVGGNSVLLTTGGASLLAVDPGTLTLQAPILSATGNSGMILLGPVLHAVDSTVTSTQPLVWLQGTSTFASTGPLVLMNGGSLTSDSILKAVGTPTIVLGGGFFGLANSNATNSNASGGVLLDLTNASATFRTLRDIGSASLTYSLNAGQPVVRMADSNLTLTGDGEPVALVDSDLNAPNGVALIATASSPGGGTIMTQGGLLQIPHGDNGVSLTDPNAQIQLTNMTVNAAGNQSMIELFSSVDLNGPFLSATSSTISTGSSDAAFVSVKTGGHLVDNDSSGNGLLSFSGSKVNGGSNLFQVRDSGSQVTLAGPLVTDEGSTFTISNNFLQIRDGASLTSTSFAPLINMSGTTFTGGDPGTNRGGSLLHMFSLNGTPGTNLSFQGSLLSASNSAFTTTDGNFINIRDGASLTVNLTGAPLLSLTSSSVKANSNVFRFGPDGTDSAGNLGSTAPVTVSLPGSLLNATDTQFTATTSGFLGLKDQTMFTGSGSGALITLKIVSGLSTVSTPSGNFLYLSAAAGTTPPSLNLTNSSGSLLNAGNTTIVTGDPSTNNFSFMFVGDGATLTSAGTRPLVTFTNSSLTTSGALLSVRRSGTGTSTVNLAGPLLSASNSSFTTSSNMIAGGCCSFVFVGEGGKLQGTGSDALLQINNSTFPNIGENFVSLAPTANLPDSTPGPSTMTLAGPLVNDSGSTFTIAGSLLRVADGSTLASTTTPPLMQFSGSTVNAGSLLILRGINTDPGTGLGTDVPLKTGGTLLELDPTTVTLNGTGNAIRVDTATLNALGPIINMINSSLATSPTGNGLMNMFQSKVTSMEVVKLDKSVLTVQNGPLLSVTGGSQMTVNADLATLLNGSKLTVVNGPLISVNGVNINGTPSALTVSGALVNFGGAGGNQVIINNNISPTATLSGIPVNRDRNPGSSISIGTNPIKNPSLGTFAVTGSAIQAINGGKVTIKAP